MKVNLYLVSIIWIFNCNYGQSREIQKRQIYREQVLPHLGGKIPDSAFETDRLQLNRLQKDGIAIPDGHHLEQRNPQVFQYTSKSTRPVYRVKVISDERYTPKEGQYSSNSADPNTIETTYSIPQIANHKILLSPNAIKSVQKHLLLPNPLFKGHPKIQAIQQHQQHQQEQQHQEHYEAVSNKQYPQTVPPSSPAASPSILSKPHSSSPPPYKHIRYFEPVNHLPTYDLPLYNLESYTKPDFSFLDQHPSYKWDYFQNDYVASNLFNDFDKFFNSLQYGNVVKHPPTVNSSPGIVVHHSKHPPALSHSQTIILPSKTVYASTSSHVQYHH